MWQFRKELKTELPFDPALPLLSMYPKEYKLFYHKDTCRHMFTVALFTIAKHGIKMSIHGRLDKVNVVHIHHVILCNHKKHEIMFSVGTWIKLEAVILSKLMQEQKTKYHMFLLLNGS